MQYKNCFFIVDTSSLLFDPDLLFYYKDNTLIIPISVIQELDQQKDRTDEVGSNAREVNRYLYSLKQYGNLRKGVLNPETKVTIQITDEDLNDIPESLDHSPDNRILSVCLTYKKKPKHKNKVYLITNDINLALKAETYGVSTLEFQPEEKYLTIEYDGHRELEEDDDLRLDILYRTESLPCPERLKARENEFFLIKNSMTRKSAFTIYQEGTLYKIPRNVNCYDIEPLNIEQAYAMRLLLDTNVKLITLTGLAGSGKTLISIAAALRQCMEPSDKIYNRLIISRSLVTLSGKDKLGYLKGSLKDKLEPYLLPLKDAIEQVVGCNHGGFEYLTAAGFDGDSGNYIKPKIEIEPLQFIRGRSFKDTFLIVDEAQNLTLSEVKAIISRMGENCKVVLLGDIDQIDSPYLSRKSNGLAQVIERFKNSKIAGHIDLKQGVRSQLATEAAERL